MMRWYWPAWSCFCIVMQALYLADGRYGLATVFFGLYLFCQAVDQILDAIRAPRETIIKIVTPEKDAA